LSCPVSGFEERGKERHYLGRKNKEKWNEEKR
jgi:hypothetical protein